MVDPLYFALPGQAADATHGKSRTFRRTPHPVDADPYDLV